MYDPIKTYKNLLNSLKSGSTFIYTYYKASAPDGYNTVEGLEKRDEVLNLILQKTYPTSISNLKPYSIVKKFKVNLISGMNNKDFIFIHIPKAAGTSISNALQIRESQTIKILFTF